MNFFGWFKKAKQETEEIGNNISNAEQKLEEKFVKDARYEEVVNRLEDIVHEILRCIRNDGRIDEVEIIALKEKAYKVLLDFNFDK